MEITVCIPEDLAKRLGTTGELERRALEALALEGYKFGRLTKPELSRLLGFETRDTLDEFLKAHDMPEPSTLADAERRQQHLKRALSDEKRREKARQAAANIIARRKGVTLGPLTIKDLINEGRR